MGDQKFKVGQVVWSDLTTTKADSLKEFYKEVIGWQEHAVGMKDEDGSYNDYAMLIDSETAAGGICHKRGVNHNIPSQWIMYIYVDEVEERLAKCLSLGGKLIHESKKSDGSYNYVIVEDPAGAVFGFGKMQ